MGEFRLLLRLGEGGMGRVYLGRSSGGRAVALKRVHPALAAAPGFRERFAREVRASQAVSGAGTVPVVAADTDAPVPWLATAYVPGPTLAEAVHDHGPLPEPALWRLLGGLARALAAVHDSGLVHRDLKPSNVLLSQDGPRLIDFGIARAADETALTGTGLVIGSAGYISPEQAEGEPVTAASDVFALGAVMTYAATGRGPFGTGSGPELLYRVVHKQPDIDDLPGAMWGVVGNCLIKRPEERFTLDRVLACAAESDDGRGDWLPAPVASAIARKAEHLLNLEAEEEQSENEGSTATPTRVDVDAHHAPTRTGPPPAKPRPRPQPSPPPRPAVSPYAPYAAYAAPPSRQGPIHLRHDPLRRIWLAPWVQRGALGRPLLSLFGLIPMVMLLLASRRLKEVAREHPLIPPADGLAGDLARFADNDGLFPPLTLLLVAALVWLAYRRRTLQRHTERHARAWAAASAVYWLAWSAAVVGHLAWLTGLLATMDDFKNGDVPTVLWLSAGAWMALFANALVTPFATVAAFVRLSRALSGDVARPVTNGA
ncbi:serine/threonine-protein kinase [Streptomyces sp. 6N223]|uniref:serine/threonine-protein kinase n=1 Tax=Streptomyces sp. 6N223 TaxID=3457412 RepID=UPI003FCF62A3